MAAEESLHNAAWLASTAGIGAAGLAVLVPATLLMKRMDGDEEYWSKGGSASQALAKAEAATATAKEGSAETAADLMWREEYGRSVLVPRVYASPPSAAARARTDITMAEVAQHNKRDDAWICVEGKAYDVTKYVEHHPGGWLPISNLAGKDVTDAFANYHPASVYERLLPNFYVGDITDYKVTPFVAEHRELRQELLRMGLFETKPSFYVGKLTWYASLFIGALYFTICRTTVSEHMLGAFLMACFWQQLAFFGHDIGHNAVSHSRKDDLWWGIAMGNLLGGISLGWWKRSHNVHHVVCNSIENDPDIQHMPIFAVVPEIFGRFWSSYHQKWVHTGFFARMLVSMQHWLYYPVMAFARFNLYVQSYILLLAYPQKETPHHTLELCTLVGFMVWFTTMLMLCIGSWKERIAYLLISHAVAGILHVQITLSHFAEDTYHGQAYNDESDEWFRMQVRTTLNVDCPEWMDWFHGGLQFQVEHHLWPRLPRHNLRQARRMVKAFCAKHDVKYKEMGFIEGNIRVVRQLYRTAMEARQLTKGDGGFYRSALYQGLNAYG